MKNIALMKQIRERISKDPHSLDMDIWANHCGTVACMAGHAGIIEKEVVYWSQSDTMMPITGESWTELGARLLGIDEETADFWFHETDNHGALEILDAFIAGEEIDILRVVRETKDRQWRESSDGLDFDFDA